MSGIQSAPKKVLIIATHFPPSNLAGIHRSRLFAQHLPSFGWTPIILTVDEKYYEEYKQEIVTVMKEYGLEDLPILYNLNFGHTEPKFILPYGAMAEINCEKKTFSILESGVQ